MLPLILTLAYSSLLLATIPVYIYIGYRLKQNILLWAFMGLGALLFLPLMCAPFLYFGKPQFLLMFWSLIQFISPVLALAIAGFTAYKKGLLNRAIA